MNLWGGVLVREGLDERYDPHRRPRCPSEAPAERRISCIPNDRPISVAWAAKRAYLPQKGIDISSPGFAVGEPKPPPDVFVGLSAVFEVPAA